VWGGLADTRRGVPWERDTRAMVFSVTKGFAAMALHLLADRGLLDFDAPVATYWPGFARGGKERLTVRTLLNHRGGLAWIDTPLTLEECIEDSGRDKVLDAIERQRPAWAPEASQGYHAITFGLYARELFERVAGEPLDDFLRRELFEPLGSDVYLGAPMSFDAKTATLYPPRTGERIAKTVFNTLLFPRSTEAKITRGSLSLESKQRKAFLNPAVGGRGLDRFNEIDVRRATLAWVSATASAHGVARSYLPFASGGTHDGRRYLKPETIEPVHRRQGWQEVDEILQKPIGWSEGFLKEERHLFSPVPQSFGHAGMGGSLGWCDPVHDLAWGYVMNRMDWRVRSPRALNLCHAIYESPPVLEASLAR